MNASVVAILLLMLVANLAWDFALLCGMSRLLAPGGPAMTYLAFPLFWLVPFAAYLVVLYRKAVLARWQRILRAVVLCGISFGATQIAVVGAAPLASFVAYGLH